MFRAFADRTGTWTLAAIPAGTYTVTVSAPATVSGVLKHVTVAAGGSASADVTLQIGLSETVVVTASRVEQLQLDAPAPVTIISDRRVAAEPTQNFADIMREVPGVNVVQMSARDFNVTPARCDQRPGVQSARDDRRPPHQPGLLRVRRLGFRSIQPRRDQADRGAQRGGLRRLGRLRHERRRQHPDQVAEGDGRHDRDVGCRDLRPAEGRDLVRQRFPLLRERHARPGDQQPVGVQGVRRVLSDGSVRPADRHDPQRLQDAVPRVRELRDQAAEGGRARGLRLGGWHAARLVLGRVRRHAAGRSTRAWVRSACRTAPVRTARWTTVAAASRSRASSICGRDRPPAS